MRFVSIDAYAKLNWSLGVVGKMENGYHELDMLLQSISLCDTLEVEKSPELILEVNGKIPTAPEKNLCIKAANAFFEYTGIEEKCRIRLTKRIPICAGMGGGSADAAGVLIALNMLFETKLSNAVLVRVGEPLGADVPFMITGGLMRARGIGEVLESKRLGKIMHMVVIMPKKGASTPNIFSAFDAIEQPAAVNNDAMLVALDKGDSEEIAKYMVNHLQSVTASINNDIDKAISILLQNGAVAAMMTGSGSACYGLFSDSRAASEAYRSIRGSQEFRSVYKVRTVHSSFSLNKLLR